MFPSWRSPESARLSLLLRARQVNRNGRRRFPSRIFKICHFFRDSSFFRAYTHLIVSLISHVWLCTSADTRIPKRLYM